MFKGPRKYNTKMNKGQGYEKGEEVVVGLYKSVVLKVLQEDSK